MNSPEPTTGETATQMLSIVVPTYHEHDNIEPLLKEISEALADSQLPYEIILVDDNSQDGSAELVEKIAETGVNARMVTRTDERGLSSAVIRGFEESKGTYLLCMDADLSHPPTAIQSLVEAIKDPKVDFVIGSRYVPGASTDEDWGLFRWLNSKIATLLARPLTSARDPMAGFFALRSEVYKRASQLNPIGYKIGLELLVKCGCNNVKEIPIHFADRRFGESKLTLKEQLNYLKHLWRLTTYKFLGHKKKPTCQY